MSQFRALILSSPGSRGERFFAQALKQVDFDAEILDVNEVLDYRIDQEQLCLKYKMLIIPGGNTYSSVLGGGRVLAIKIAHAFKWNLQKFAERGGLVLGVGTGFQTLLNLKIFGDDYTLKMNEQAENEEKWVKAIPSGSRCIWLRGLGTLELPLNQMDTEFVIDPAAYVEAQGKLERLNMACLKDEKQEKIYGVCDITGRILGLLPHPEYFLTWTQAEDWYLTPTRAAAPGQGFSLFENAARYCAQ
ncbi:MAG: phosphoribosylformylglycinamidine synthase subunit PurQ [Bdellovibrionales bacterium]|nr:phosphoribosylformylglycinamidine synthase subunit PurQ [Oligoflexia bacterium]